MEKSSAQELGYFLFPPRRPTEPGFSRLEVILRERPSLHHFDPDQVHLLVVSPEGGAETLKLTHPWSGVCEWRMCAGQIDLLDRKGKHVDLFTFGGELSIEKVDDISTRLVFTSEAPFLLTQPHTSSTNLLVQEVEIQMAQLRAAWCRKNDNFDDCLACLDAFDLYRMCLAAILERFELLEYDETVFKLRHVLQDELAAIGFASLTLADLEDVRS